MRKASGTTRADLRGGTTETVGVGETPEFSRRIRLADLEPEGRSFELEAVADERGTLARRFKLQSLDRLSALVDVRPLFKGDMIQVEGRFVADVLQTCVVTLEDAPARVEDSFVAYFTTDPALAEASAEEIEIALEAEDPPELVTGGVIDVGEVVAQHFVLALDPYPRAPGASAEALEYDTRGEAEEPSVDHPFAALGKLRRKGG